MQITGIDNNQPQFKGLTRTLSRNYFASFEEIQDVFIKHPKANNIAGSLPYSWIKPVQNKPKEIRDNSIKQVYEVLREIFGENIQSDVSAAKLKEKSRLLTKTMHKAGILPNENIMIIKKRKLDGSMISGVFTIHEKGKNPTLEKIFIKKFKNKIPRAYQRNDGGLYAETALGLHFNKLMADRHILKMFWADIDAGYIASRYEVQPKNVKIPKPLLKCSDEREKQAYFKKLMSITGDFTDIRKILAKYGFVHKDYHDENLVITRDKKGNLITRLIDLGRIIKGRKFDLDSVNYINYNQATKSFE